MTQQDDITQRVLTDDELQALWDEACKDSPQAPGWNRHLRYGRAVVAALLSKSHVPTAIAKDKTVHVASCRAITGLPGCDCTPVADERAALIALCALEADGKHADESAIEAWERARAALASAPSAGQQPIVHQHGFAADNQRLRAINESLDKQLEEVMTERDNREDVIDKLLDIVLGADRSEWSSEYGYGHAVIEVEERMHALASAPVAGEAICKTCGGSRVDPGGLPICRDCGPVAGEAKCAERDMLEEARAEIEMIREALGVSYEPHQSLFDRMLEACDGIRHAAKARGVLEWIGPNGTAAGPALVADVPGGWVRCNADGANIGGNFLTLLQEIAEDSTQADKDGGQQRYVNMPAAGVDIDRHQHARNVAAAWAECRAEVGTAGWTVSESINYHGFFLHGWRAALSAPQAEQGERDE